MPAGGERPVPGLSGLPGHLLRRCHQISVGLFLDECYELDLTPLQFSVLKTLAELGPQDQATLGGNAALDRTTVAVVLKKLEERGLVIREQSRRDRRSKIVRITPAGHALAEQALPAILRAQERTLAPLAEDERQTLLALLQKLAVALNAESRAPLKARRPRSEG